MAMQKIRGSIEGIDDPSRSGWRGGVRITRVAFLRDDRVVRMVLPDDGDAGLLRGEIRRRNVIGPALFFRVGDSSRGGLVLVDGRSCVGGSASCRQNCGEEICHRPRVADRPTFVDSRWSGHIHIVLGGT